MRIDSTISILQTLNFILHRRTPWNFEYLLFIAVPLRQIIFDISFMEKRYEGERERENKNGRLSTSNSLSRRCHFAVETEKRAKLDKVRETFSCACDVESDKGPSVVRWTCSVSRRDSWHDVSPRGKLFNNARPDFALARCCRMMESR